MSELIEPEKLIRELRAAKPAAPETLRERVRALPAPEPPPRTALLERFRFPPRRLLLAVPAALFVAVLGASVIGLSRDSITDGRDEVVSGSSGGAVQSDAALEAAPPTGAGTDAAGKALVPPDSGRLQQYNAELSLRVDGVEELSDATRRAMRIARTLGGHVASVQYEAPTAGIGGAQLVLRVPTARVETAVVQLSALGTILSQRVGIQDLEGTVDSLEDQIAAAEREVASLLRQLRAPSLTEEARAELEIRLADARRQVADLRAALRSTRAEGQLATVSLSLTTEEIAADTGGGSRLDDVLDVLAWEGIALLYALVVAGPFLLVGLGLWLFLRRRRRREEAQLLDRS